MIFRDRVLRNTAEEELREFMIVLRRALLLVVRWIEARYNLEPDAP